MKRLKRKNFFEPLPENSILVARPSKWGNPFKLSEYNLEECLRLYEKWLQEKLRENPSFLDPLRGKDLVCYCRLDNPCHADILLNYLNKS